MPGVITYVNGLIMVSILKKLKTSALKTINSTLSYIVICKTSGKPPNIGLFTKDKIGVTGLFVVMSGLRNLSDGFHAL